MEILCFFAGIVFVYTKSLFALLFIGVALFLKASRIVVVWFLAAIFWASAHQWWVADRGMPIVPVIQKAMVQGKITSIPISNSTKTQFQFLLNRLDNKVVKATILLSCYNHCPSFQVGQLWQFKAKLKIPQNLGNPGSFDFKSGLLARHIQWTGYIKEGNSFLLNDPSEKKGILPIREQLADTLKQHLHDSSSLGIVQALTLGVTTNISKSQWDLFRRTGTTHLMVISGAHIGLVAGLIFWFVHWLWSRSSRLCVYKPAVQIAGISGLLMAALYSLLAGFAVPAQRALAAYFFVMLKYFKGYRLTGWQSWRYALLIVQMVEPHAVLLPGFYLSFLAVAILIASSQRIRYQGFKKAVFLQMACLWGLMPLTLYWFSYGALNGLIANLIAIPLVGYIIVPLSLLCLLLIQIIPLPGLISALHFVIHALLIYLGWVDKFALVNLNFSLTTILSMFSLVVGSFVLIFLPIKKFFLASLVLILVAFFPPYARVKMKEALIDVLDVGQGLSVVVRTSNHTLVYDTGMKFYQGGDMAQMAIIPYLTTLGIKKIDKVVISHPDLDHRGGLPSLKKKYPIEELLVDNVKFYHEGKNCHQYPEWIWDGITFKFFPIKQTFRDKNNSSCVLQISNGKRKLLLTGDIEKLAENYLVATYNNEIASDVLIVAHHGSKTSSSPLFVKYVSPKFAVISAGFDNRYHFPHPKTLATFTQQDIQLFNTINCGMVSVKLHSTPSIFTPSCHKRSIN